MHDTILREAVGIRAGNSCSFVEQVLAFYQEKIPFVILKSSQDVDALPGIRLKAIHTPGTQTGWIAFESTHFADDDLPAQVTFTSGTEGPPKAIVLSYRALADVVERLNHVMALDSTVREYVGVPASYSFGLGRHRACAAVGGKAFVPSNGFNPVEIADMLRDAEINAISAVPTLWRTVLMNADLFSGVGRRVRWIEIGSQYMSRGEKEDLKRIFPEARIVQHYGLTEASRSTFLDVSRTEGDALESVGKAVGNTEVRVSPEGLVQIRGSHLALGTLSADGVRPLVDTAGWLTTKDNGRIEDGYLYYHGRADDLINCGGIKLSPDTLEQKLFESLGSRCGMGVGRFAHELRGDGVLVAVEKNAGVCVDRTRRETLRILAELGVNAGDALRVCEIDQLPQTETGKVRRQELEAVCSKESTSSMKESSPDAGGVAGAHEMSEIEAKVVSAWQRVLKKDSVSRTTSFYENGGDSLTAIGLMLALDRAGVDRGISRRIFNGETIAEIVSRKDAPETIGGGGFTERAASDVINIVRGALVLILIAIHFLPGVWERLPVNAEKMGEWLYPFYRLGTPGFAFVFGLGVGYFYFHQMMDGMGGVWRRIRLSAMIVFSGMVILGIFRVGAYVAQHSELPQKLFVEMFFSVLSYYFLAILSIPLWFKWICRRGGDAMVRALVASVVCYMLFMILDAVVGKEPLSFGVFEWGRLMLETKYSYFRMTAIVMLGVAIGLHYRKQTDFFESSSNYLVLGTLIFVASTMVPIDMGFRDRWWTMADAELFAVLGYAGVVIVFLGLVGMIRPVAGRNGVAGWGLKVLAACGVLALPSYVAHGLVIPGKDMLVGFLGIKESVALLFSLGMFGAASFIAIRKVVRLYG